MTFETSHDMSVKEDRVFLITGASRSGTTLLNSVLGNHSEVLGLRELQYFGQAWDPRNTQRRFSHAEAVKAAAAMIGCQEFGVLAHKVTEEHRRKAIALVDALPDHGADPATLFATTVRALTQAAGKTIPCEQTPRYIFYARALLELYPAAHVVHIVRDPRAVMASQKKRWQRRTLATDKRAISRYQSLRVWVNYHPYSVALLWSGATKEAAALATHPRVTVLRFEDLIQKPESTVRQLCARLGINFEERMLNVGQINSSHQSSVGGARRGLHADAVDKWRDVLTPTEIEITQRHCAPLMSQFGYESDTRNGASFLGKLGLRASYVAHLGGVLLVNPRRACVQAKALFRRRARYLRPAATTATSSEAIARGNSGQ